MKSWIPNGFTAANLVFGMGSLLATFHAEYQWAALLVFIAALSDALDGRVARYLNVSSDFGKELDSLCDLVSFGVAPAFLAYSFLLKDFHLIGIAVAIFFPVCGAFRLARFNVNTSVVKGYFMGMPIPAAGCAVASFILMGIRPENYLFPAFVALFGYLMVSTIRYPDFKGKEGEPLRVLPAIVALLTGGCLLYLLPNAYVFAPFAAYALFGLLNTLARKLT
ncbi:CDP-diacylglycerol--serine O-phosphatidyltransferase [Azotosporobacter soli]|uniref:CDP-diacylglycerol--serine O-phosphatidyltransferase n=1 Tax=Azotosporobacter soli TaxID=3055040 RepID=UPI0031FF42B1